VGTDLNVRTPRSLSFQLEIKLHNQKDSSNNKPPIQLTS